MRKILDSSFNTFSFERTFPDYETKKNCIKSIKKLLKHRDAVMVAHYYTHPEIQKLVEETGGCVADSLEMAQFGTKHSASTILVVGVRFMGETAKILNPEKKILMPDLKAECSLDLGCPIEDFNNFCNGYPERTVVVYANTSAEVKARADWVVTSSIALELIDYLDSAGKKILWAPDKHLGFYIQKKTGADLISWKGSCIVHDEFKKIALKQMKSLHCNAAILVHPESPYSVIEMADVVGSTSQLISAAKSLPHPKLIVATERGIFYKMQEAVPQKELIEAPTSGEGATCQSCARCPWMAMNSIKNILQALEHDGKEYEIHIDDVIRQRALIPLKRMMKFAKKN